MAALESTELGSTNRTVSRLGFGGAPAGFANYLEPYSPDQAGKRDRAIAAIQHAADRGITYFDTAAAYGDGESERILGEALEGRVTHPAEVLLGSPTSEPVPTETHTQNGAGQSSPAGSQPRRPRTGHGQSPPVSTAKESGDAGETGSLQPAVFIATKAVPQDPDIRGSIERSLRNLRVDRIDLVQVHGGSYTEVDENNVMRSGGVLDILEKARDEGLVRHIGFTAEDQTAPVYRFIESRRFEVMQIQYNLLFQHPYSPERPFGCMIAAQEAGMGIVTMRALTAGVFQRWMATIRPDDRFDYSAALLQFTLSNPLIDVALAGMRTPDEVDRNIAVLDNKADRVDLDELHKKFV